MEFGVHQTPRYRFGGNEYHETNPIPIHRRVNLSQKLLKGLWLDHKQNSVLCCAKLIIAALSIGVFMWLAIAWLEGDEYAYVNTARPVNEDSPHDMSRVGEATSILKQRLEAQPDIQCMSCPCAGINLRCLVWNPLKTGEVWLNPIIEFSEGPMRNVTEITCLHNSEVRIVERPQKIYVRHGPTFDRHLSIVDSHSASSCVWNAVELFTGEWFGLTEDGQVN